MTRERGGGGRPGFSEGRLRQLRAFLAEESRQAESSEIVHSVSELDGYFTSLMCATHTVLPSEWMPQAIGGYVFEDEAEIEAIWGLLMEHYNSVSKAIQDLETFEPLVDVYEREDGGLTPDHPAWCRGFLTGLRVHLHAWQLPEGSDLDDTLEAILAVAVVDSQDDWDDLYKMLSPDEVQDWIADSVRDTFALSRQMSGPAGSPRRGTVTRSIPKVGRNDPCPCGSGRKFKKCCGGPGRNVH